MYFNFLMDDEIIHQKNTKSYEAPLGAKNDLAIFCNSPLVRYKKHQSYKVRLKTHQVGIAIF